MTAQAREYSSIVKPDRVQVEFARIRTLGNNLNVNVHNVAIFWNFEGDIDTPFAESKDFTIPFHRHRWLHPHYSGATTWSKIAAPFD